MDFLKLILGIFVLFIAGVTPLTASEARIADYFGGRQAAFSFTFDDGFRQQVENTVEIIDPLGIKGTFFIIPLRMEDPRQSGMSLTWERANELQANGHEIGTHNTVAIKLHEASRSQLEDLILDSARLIKDRTGIPPVSYARPGGSKFTPEALAIIRQDHYFIRSAEHLPNMQLMRYGSVGRRVWDDKKTRGQIESHIADGKWMVPVVHAIVSGYSPFKSKAEFREHCTWLAAQQDRLWIAPMGTVGRYVFQRDAATLDIVESTSGKCVFKVSHSLANKEVFNHPMTVIIPAPGAREAIGKDINGNEIPVTIRGDEILATVAPDGQPYGVFWR